MRHLLIQINNISKRTKLWVFIFYRGAGDRLLSDYLHTSLPNWVIFDWDEASGRSHHVGYAPESDRIVASPRNDATGQ